MTSRSRPIAALVAAVAAVALLVPASAGAYRTNTKDKPIIFVHGYDFDGDPPANNCEKTWGLMEAKLALLGWTGRMETIGYYEGDTNCTAYINQARGSVPDHWWTSEGHYPDDGHSREANIRHLGFHLAWWIYNHYSKYGQTVDIVAHSMGGLIARYAIYRVDSNDPEFPPFLYVEDAVTLGTPHGGARWFDMFCPSFQCEQMQMGSQFLVEMQKYAWNPQALDGTDWTSMGSGADDLVGADRAAGWDSDVQHSEYFGSCHKVWYWASVGIGHSDYRTDISDNEDADVFRTLTDVCGGVGFVDHNRYHPVRQTALALYSGKW